MNSDPRLGYLLRQAILNLLSDEEVARVSTIEAEDGLFYGDEYIDLEQLELGVKRALGETPPMGRVLAKKAVHHDTWTMILAELAIGPLPLAHQP